MVELHLYSEAYVYHVNVTFILETLRNNALLSKSPQQNHFRQSKVLIACSPIFDWSQGTVICFQSPICRMSVIVS